MKNSNASDTAIRLKSCEDALAAQEARLQEELDKPYAEQSREVAASLECLIAATVKRIAQHRAALNA